MQISAVAPTLHGSDFKGTEVIGREEGKKTPSAFTETHKVSFTASVEACCLAPVD